MLAAAFVAVMAIVVLNDGGVIDRLEVATSWNAMALIYTAAFLAGGYVVGRWWVLILAPLVWVSALIASDSSEAIGLLLVLGVPAAATALALGVLLRKATGRPAPAGE